MNQLARTTALSTVLAISACAAAQSSPGGSYYDELIRSLGIEQKIGSKANLAAEFTNEAGKTVKLGDLLKGKPLLILPTYYSGPTSCPMLTDNLLKTLARTTKANALVLGRDLNVVMLGLNPKEGPKEASARKAAAMKAVMEDKRAQSNLPEHMQEHWSVLTGSLDQIRSATDSIGFKYRYDEKKGSIDYPTGTVLLTPDGRISAYTIANEIPTRILERNVAKASRGELSEKADQVQMFGCLSYDPSRGPYRDLVQNIIRVTGTLTVLILGFSIFAMSRKPKGSSSDSGGAPKA